MVWRPVEDDSQTLHNCLLLGLRGACEPCPLCRIYRGRTQLEYFLAVEGAIEGFALILRRGWLCLAAIFQFDLSAPTLPAQIQYYFAVPILDTFRCVFIASAVQVVYRLSLPG